MQCVTAAWLSRKQLVRPCGGRGGSLRPASHVQGAWCCGFSHRLAVSNTIMKKDTNNNIKVVPHLLRHLSDAHSGLPTSLHLQQGVQTPVHGSLYL